jgi:hypothetical protein
VADAARAKARADKEAMAAGQAGADVGPVATSTVGARYVAAATIFMEPKRRLWWRISGGTTVESSSDGGHVWKPSFQDDSMRLLAGSAPDTDVVWVAGARGVVMRRVAPAGWVRVTAPASDDLVAIAATSASSAQVTTRSGQGYETRDGGTTWRAR